MNIGFLGPAVATVLTVYGIETCLRWLILFVLIVVATVLTVYGIETSVVTYATTLCHRERCNSTYRLRY